MRRLTHNEDAALHILARRGSLVPGDSIADWTEAGLMFALEGLVRKKRAQVEMTDDGPRYSLTAMGLADAA